MATNIITSIFEGTQGTGFYEYVLPFLLVFALIYALLDQIDTLGENGNEAVLAVIALALSFFVVYSGLLWPFMALFSGPLALILVLVLSIMIAAQLVGLQGEGNWFDTAIGIIAVVGVAALIVLRGGLAAVYCSGPSTDMATSLCEGPLVGDIAIFGVDLATLVVVLFAVGALVWIVNGGIPFVGSSGGGNE